MLHVRGCLKGEIESGKSELPRLSWIRSPLRKYRMILLVILFEEMLKSEWYYIISRKRKPYTLQ